MKRLTPVRYLQRRRQDYKEVFGSPQGERVLKDLHTFCGADKQSHSSDSHQTAFNEGLRRVWLRINGYLSMTDEQITRLLRDNADE